VDSIERDRRKVDKIDMTVQSPVEAKVAQVGGNAVEVG